MVIFASLPKTGSSQPNTAADAWSKIVEAFSTLQTADSHGAPHESIVTLSNQLNTALAYYNNATILAAQNNTAAADNYALSITISTSVTSEAKTLDDVARNQQLARQELAYGAAFVLAVVSAALVVEIDRIQRLFRKKRTVRIERESS